MTFKDEAKTNKRGKTTLDYVDKMLWKKKNKEYGTSVEYNMYGNITSR
jgi:hypothetical protein